jgi:hypothetical protein
VVGLFCDDSRGPCLTLGKYSGQSMGFVASQSTGDMGIALFGQCGGKLLVQDLVMGKYES